MGTDAVVLDLDDTLLDHRGSTRRALEGWLDGLGARSDPSLERAWFEVEDRHFDAWRAGLIGFEEQRRRRLRDVLPLLGRAVGTDEELDAAFAGYLGWYKRSWRAFPDVRPALEALAARGLVVAVLTNGRAEQQRAKVRAIGIEEEVSFVLTSEEVGAAKPAAEAFLGACRRLGTPRTGWCTSATATTSTSSRPGLRACRPCTWTVVTSASNRPRVASPA